MSTVHLGSKPHACSHLSYLWHNTRRLLVFCRHYTIPDFPIQRYFLVAMHAPVMHAPVAKRLRTEKNSLQNIGTIYAQPQLLPAAMLKDP
jgi:hypothetical protein